MPHGERSHFCAPLARKSTGVRRTSTGTCPIPWIASTMSHVPVARVARDSASRSTVYPVLNWVRETQTPRTLGSPSRAISRASSGQPFSVTGIRSSTTPSRPRASHG